ncbi:MAG: hypothetical protein EOP47_01090 [Sphingobacteriaceae bacterium]|nr:MAG: hypothetical protein EOP47_01090 [Sphingobacteriaceae bacterium]
MQDKEFDRLFSSKLENFEAEPSPMVWENIANEVSDKKAKRSVVPYLSIAASVIILVSVGFLFFNQTEEAFVKPVKRGKVVAKINKAETFDDTTKSTVVTTSEITKVVTNKVANVLKHKVLIAPKAIVDEPVNQITTESNDRVINNPIAINQAALAIITTIPKEPVMEVPDKETLFASTDKQQTETITTETTSTEITQIAVKKRGIHSLGGLINVIVAKVDKREDKLIEFTERDENGSTITGLNLGFVRIKKK